MELPRKSPVLPPTNAVVDERFSYCFHKPTWIHKYWTPDSHPEAFQKRGKSDSNSQRWYCKHCYKTTNTRPSLRESFSCHQKRNDILPTSARLLVARTPIKQACQVLGIGMGTYYDRLEWVYRRCLECLAKPETSQLAGLERAELWLCSDQLLYNINNMRMWGKGGIRYKNVEERFLSTHIVATGERKSGYIFRADIAYDWDIGMADIVRSTLKYKDDHLDIFCRRYGRLRRFSYFPMRPAAKDEEPEAVWRGKLELFQRRARYVWGLHVNSTYTAFAQFWLIRESMKQVRKWFLTTDNDGSLITAFARAFADQIREGTAHHFLCLMKELPVKKAYEEWGEAKNDRDAHALAGGLDPVKDEYRTAVRMLTKAIEDSPSFEPVKVGFGEVAKPTRVLYEHPMPAWNEGKRSVGCLTGT